MCEQVRFGHRLMVVGAGNKAHYVTVSISLFEIIHNFKKIEKKGLAGKGRRGRGGAEWTGSIFDGPSKTPRPDVSFSPCSPHLPCLSLVPRQATLRPHPQIAKEEQ